MYYAFNHAFFLALVVARGSVCSSAYAYFYCTTIFNLSVVCKLGGLNEHKKIVDKLWTTSFLDMQYLYMTLTFAKGYTRNKAFWWRFLVGCCLHFSFWEILQGIKGEIFSFSLSSPFHSLSLSIPLPFTSLSLSFSLSLSIFLSLSLQDNQF